MISTRTVQLKSGARITLTLDGDLFTMPVSERRMVFELLDQLTYEAPSLIARHLGPDVAAVLEQVKYDPKAPLVLDEAAFLGGDPSDLSGLDDACLRNVADKADVERDLKPENLINVAPVKPITPVEPEPIVPLIPRRPHPESGPAADAVLVRPRGAVVEQAKSLDAFRSAAAERREKLVKDAARAKERLAAARTRAQELTQRVAPRRRVAVDPDNVTPLRAGELPEPIATFHVAGKITV